MSTRALAMLASAKTCLITACLTALESILCEVRAGEWRLCWRASGMENESLAVIADIEIMGIGETLLRTLDR